FLARAAERLGVCRKTMTLEAMVLLSRQDWPGNVRELQNVVERIAVLHADAELLGVDDLPAELRASAAPLSAEPADLAQLPYPDALAAFERDYLERLFERTQGNITEAARLASMSRGHLHRKARQLGVEADRF